MRPRDPNLHMGCGTSTKTMARTVYDHVNERPRVNPEWSPVRTTATEHRAVHVPPLMPSMCCMCPNKLRSFFVNLVRLALRNLSSGLCPFGWIWLQLPAPFFYFFSAGSVRRSTGSPAESAFATVSRAASGTRLRQPASACVWLR